MLKKNKGLLLSLLVMLLWGLLFPTVKVGYKAFGIAGVGPILSFAGFRFIICGVVITVFALIRDSKCLKPALRHWKGVLLSGLFAIVLHYTCTYLGLSMTTGSKTAILKQLGAIFYICFSALIFPSDKLTPGKVAGLILGLSGIFAINADSGGFTFGLGDWLIIGASFCTVASNTISKKLFTSVEPIISTGISQLFGGIVLLAVGLPLGGNMSRLIPTNPHQFLVFGVILTASIISYCLWFINVKQENLSKLYIIKFAEPLFASVFGWFLLGEDILKINYLAAFILISAGILVANIKKNQES